MTQQNAIAATPNSRIRMSLLDWLRPGNSSSALLGGSLIMLAGSSFVSLINFAYSVAMARMLGPASFGNLSAVATLLMLASAVTLSFQLVCAKFVAKNETIGGKSAVYSSLMQKAWWIGVLVCLGLLAASPLINNILRLGSPLLVALLAAGIAFYVPLGVRRGAMQGVCAFPRLSFNFVLETVTKFGLAIVLVALGYGVMGAVAAISLSVAAAFFFPRDVDQVRAAPVAGIPASFREGMQAIVFFVGQVVINNIDILLVKYYFASQEAGLYAAVALVGRVLYFAAWSIVSAMFPISAAARDDERPVQVLATPMLMVLAISILAVVLLAAFPHLVVNFVFGGSFKEAEPLLSLYAVATGLYALAVVAISYEMSRKIANTGWLQLLFSGAIIGGIALFHRSLTDVIFVQIVLMALMLFVVMLPFVRSLMQTRSLQKAKLHHVPGEAA
jgi:O-antigen/teichoic acid export membrane protein